jgi:lipopolysaccharide/colanic/teichoic acid biosynthesis glycosyltransferase
MGIAGILRRVTGHRAPAFASLHAAGEFRLLLERERLRSDRTGAVFSLAAFTIPPPGGASAELALAKILVQRLRAIDDAGYLSDGRIAALLPETAPAGAWTLANDIARKMEAAGSRVECRVFAYPRGGIVRRCDPPHGDRLDEGPQQERNGGTGNGAAHDSRDAGEVDSVEVLLAQGLPVWKRALDLCGAALLILVTAPLMLAAALAVKLTSRGPVLFAQRRDGLGGQPFTMYKFRTMTVDAEDRKADLRRFSEQDGPAFKMAHDPRVTRVGRLLRASSIDELPQLWNVLRGEMSLVGPRPLPCDESSACERWQRRRLDVTPGLTCIWQVAGRSLVSFAEWVRMDLQYVDRRTLRHDLKLLALTLPALLLKRGK